MTRYLHVSIGPVQSFVAQARRTRDLWGGSYLLSLLSAHAMRGARAARAEIIQPLVEADPLLAWAERRPGAAPPPHGSLPNQFTVALAHPDDLARVVAQLHRAFDDTWHRICEAVWRVHVAPIADHGHDTRAIWERQVRGFWEIVWVSGDTPHGLLDRRKHWRTHRLPEEAGDKCTVMPELQELSGFVRAHDRKAQDAFWCRLRNELGRLELRDNERLCAIALVKRLYAVTASEIVGAIDVKRWPSTIDVAAAPWIQRASAVAPRQLAEFAAAVERAADDHVLTGGASSLIDAPGLDRKARELGVNWFHRGFTASPRLAKLDPSREAARADLLQRLRALGEIRGAHGRTLGGPPIYYALLLADGDSLGALLARGGGALVSRALAGFTAQVAEIVAHHQGRTVYAGGDDVLAVLAVEHALDCAHALEHAFRRAFLAAAPDEEIAARASLSIAVVFAHARSPLPRVIEQAHHLLDDIAKDQNGRASLAAAIYRGATITGQWATTWQRPASAPEPATDSSCDHGEACAIAQLHAAVCALAADAGALSSSLLHDLRHLIGLLCGEASDEPGHFAHLDDALALHKLIRAEIHHRLARQDREPEAAELDRLTRVLAPLLARAHRVDGEPRFEPRQVGLDGLVLASFLARGGQEDDHP
ncbi:MAG TPA: type III-B CRISPR-associated protein Cas10/Cmr2 [Kofleriaceae bacterium]|nr:type III-B CRISPR-associated protein Cas10/Cmr2 [Kofleriaceae bacterium]